MGKIRDTFYYLIIVIIFLYFLCCPSVCLLAASEGIALWYKSIVPTLFPFMIASHIFVSTGMIQTLLAPFRKYICKLTVLSEYGLFAVIIGFLCGFPMGVKILKDLYHEKLISKEECTILGPLINQVSPGFIIVYTAEKQFQNYNLSGPMICIIYGSVLFYWIAFCGKKKKSLKNTKQKIKRKKTINGPEMINIIDESIIASMEQLIHICGYIMLFSILSSIFFQINLSDTAASTLSAVLEISNGIHKISLLKIPFVWRFRITNTILAFGGFCSAMQSYTYMKMFDLKLKNYIKTKAMIAFIAFIFSFMFISSEKTPTSVGGEYGRNLSQWESSITD